MNSLRSRARLVALAATFVVGAAFGVELLLSLGEEVEFGHSRRGHVLGWVGLLILLLVFVYPLKKRYAPEAPRRGWIQPWFRVHLIAGILGPVLILIHAGAHFHALVPVLALVALALVTLSGVVGQTLHSLAVRQMNQQWHELQKQDLAEAEIQERLTERTAQEEAFRFWQLVHAPVTIPFVALTLLHIIGALFFGGW
ncbi:MAG: hypothetical protein AB7G48_20870 [Nitrospiraceae bacterium]